MRATILFVLGLALSALPTWSATDDLIISEFMASNSSTLADEDGAFSDWIEIYNRGDNTVNLGGWYLTDSANNLTKWQFPATNLAPHNFMVVFASSKNRRIPGRPLHTSYNLNVGGEYLGLVKPDGVTVVSQFSPQFPNQFNDIAYGFIMSGTTFPLLSSTGAVRALVPAGDIGTTWRNVAFDDSSWLSGALGVGYDLGTNYQPAIGLDVGAAMSNVNASAYIRVPFMVTNLSEIKALTMRLRYDDGFVAYLNGSEIVRRNAPASPSWNSTATAVHGPPPPGALVEAFESGNAQFTLNQYGAAPAPAVQPAGAGSTGSFLRLLYDGVNGAGNSVTFRQTAPGLFDKVVAEFDFRMSNAANNPADGFAFMLIPTATYGTTGAGINTTGNAVEEPNFAGVFAIGFDVYPHATQNDVSVHWSGEKLNVTIPRGTFEMVAGVFHRAKVTLQHVPGGARVTVTFTPNINGAAGAPYTPINNFFVSGLNAYESRVQFAGRTGGLNHALDLDNINVQFLPPPGLIAFEEFILSRHIGLLTEGTNVLAIQGLNIAAADGDFLIQPEINASDFVITPQANYIAPATPGTWNNVAAAGTLPPVAFSPAPGVYTSNSIAITLASGSSSALIRYTLDGSEPSASSLLYTNPITVSANAVIRARAFETGRIESEVTGGNYVLLDSSLTNFTSNLPLVVVDTIGGTVAVDSKIPAYAVFIETNDTGRATFTGPVDHSGRINIEYRGQSSFANFPKKSFNVELNSEKDKDKKAPLLGMPKGSDWALYAPYTDKTFMNDVLAYELHGAMGHYSVRRRYVEVFVRSTAGRLSTNDYLGLYVLLEKIRVDEDRVDIAKLDDNDETEPDITGGYIWKKDKDSPGDVNFTTSSGQFLKYHDPKGTDLTAAQRAWLSNHLNHFEAALYSANWRDPLNGYAKFIEIPSFVDQHWIVEFPKNIDGYRLSNYMSKDREGKIRMEPIWDWNLSFGNANYLQGGMTNGWYFQLLSSTDDIWLSRLRTDPEFYQKIIDRWGELRTNVLALTNVIRRIDRITNQLWEAQARDFVRWPRLGTYIWPNPNGTGEGRDVNYQSPTTYAGIIEQMKKWVTGRYTWIDQQFLKAPTLSLPGGPISPGASLTMGAPLGTIYYTLDGTDPRAPGGAISSAALPYTGAITLHANAGVMARAFHTNGWSPVASAVYVVSTPTLAITEIMYHPADPPAGSPWSASDFEFIEIKNTGTNAINLRGTRLGGGIDYTFLPSVSIPTGAPTANNFDAAGTSYTSTTLNSGPASAVTPLGPNGNFLRLISGGSTNLTRNRVAFDQTATGSYARVTAQFDFRALTVPPASTSGPMTFQDFDGSLLNTPYTNNPTATLQPADAGSSGAFLRLVPAVGGMVGVAGFDRTATGGWNSVTATFDFRITPPNEGNQADGMGFALLPVSAYGATGVGPAFSEEVNLPGTIGLGIDVYNNAEVNNNHLSLHWNGAIVGAPATPTFDLSNGRFHRAQVQVRYAPGNIAFVTVRVTPDINGTPGQTVTLFQDVQINSAAPYESRAGFAARTGGQVAAHDIDNVRIEYSTDRGAAAGLSLTMLPANRFGGTGAGSTLAHYTDTPALSNALALDLAFNASNSANDVSLYLDRALVASASPMASTLDLDGGVFHRVSLDVTRGINGSYVTLQITPNSLGVPGAPITVVSNLYVPGLLPEHARAEFAGRNANLDTTLDLENVDVRYYDYEPLILNPGECILVVRNRAAFESVYGTSHRIAGEFTGQLNNAGDRIVLLGPNGEPILDFEYSDDWYRITDGLGFSLVNLNPTAPGSAYGSSTNWRNSSYQGGSPGSVDSVLVIPPVLINEMLANSVPPEVDTIELHNPTTNSVDVSGWYLTDDFFTPKKFRIPNGTTIPPGGFAVFTEAQFNAAPGAETSFGLGADGDEVWLFSADGSDNLTGYVHGSDFGASVENVSFGRYVDSTGNEQFPPQALNTFGATNAGPRVTDIVISEIMYRPADSGDDDSLSEFIEIANIGAAAVPLYSTEVPTETWQLQDAVEFSLPQNVSLAAGERLLVVNFSPTNTAVLDAFRAKYGVASGVQIYGPYRGKLDNSSDDVELHQPLPPSTNGTLYARVDRVRYRDEAPWPAAADGYGASLHRVALNAFGNDPINWFAATPSAGAASSAGTAPGIDSQPADVTVVGGSSATFSVAANGANLRYQWRANGTNILDATNATLVLQDVELTQAGLYHVAVFHASGSVLSSNAFLTVLAPVRFTLEPVSQNVLPQTNVTLVAEAVGTGTLYYQWHFNGAPIPSATSASYSFTGAWYEHHGDYHVTVRDDVSSATSSNAFIYVLIPPGFAVQPKPATVLQGQTAVFTVVATGAPPLFYRWTRNGQTYPSDGTGTLIVTNALVNGSFRCLVANQARTNVGSSAVQLVVLADNDRDGMWDNWERNYGFNTNDVNDALADTDGDLMINRDEYIANTIPTNALSLLKLFQSATNSSTLQFVAQSNVSYTVRYSTNLMLGGWKAVTNIDALPTPRTITVETLQPASEPERYYRVVTPQE